MNNIEINNNNLYLLLPGIVAGVARLYSEEHVCSQIEALRQVYKSSLYTKLAKENTKLWHCGPVALMK